MVPVASGMRHLCFSLGSSTLRGSGTRCVWFVGICSLAISGVGKPSHCHTKVRQRHQIVRQKVLKIWEFCDMFLRHLISLYFPPKKVLVKLTISSPMSILNTF